MENTSPTAPNATTIDNSQFPLTTQMGLSPQDQALIDSINLDDLNRAIENGKILSEKQKMILQELETKNNIRKAAKANATRNNQDDQPKDVPPPPA